MTKYERESIRVMFGGRCAYCGNLLGNTFHVDHVTPMFRGRGVAEERDKSAVKYPSCCRCNLWKKTFSVEQFRQEIMAQPARLLRDSAAFRLASDLGMVEVHYQKPVFYFENFAAQMMAKAKDSK
jgi:hypothetical protein